MRYVFLICTLLFSYIIQAQTIPQVNNIPWYEFTKKLSVGERFKIPQDTLSLPAGATVRDTTGLIALKNGTLYRLYNGSWRAVMNGIDSVNRVGDSIIFYNSGVRLAGVYSPALTANNGTRIASSVIKLDDGTNPLTENVFIDGVTNSMDFGLNSRVGTWSLQRSMTYNGFAAGANDSVKFDINTMAVKFTGASAGDGNTTIGKKNAITTLSADLTGDRTLTFPYKINDPGFLLYIINKNTTSFDWIVAGAPVEDGNGTAITTIERGLWFFMWDGEKWIRQAGGGGSGTVTNIATNTATGITGGPITTTGTLAIDTNLLKTHASHKKAIDSLGALIKTDLNSLTDVTISSPSIGQVLKYNGSAWVNDTDATGGGTNPTVSAVSSNTTIAANYIYHVTTTGGNVTMTINAATLFSSPTTQFVTIKKVTSDANTVILGTIEGSERTLTNQWESVTIYSDGTNLFIKQ